MSGEGNDKPSRNLSIRIVRADQPRANFEVMICIADENNRTKEGQHWPRDHRKFKT